MDTPISVPNTEGIRVTEDKYGHGDPDQISEVGQPEVIVITFPLKPRPR